MRFSTKANLRMMGLFLFICALGTFTFLQTNELLEVLRQEEIKKARQWAMSVSSILQSKQSNKLQLNLEVMRSNTTIPVILVDSKNNILSSKNINEARITGSARINDMIQKMKKEHQPLEIPLGQDTKQYLYYGNSILFNKLRVYPILLTLFIMIISISGYNLAISLIKRKIHSPQPGF